MSTEDIRYDKNTLFVKIGLARRDQIEKAFTDAILKLNIATSFYVNIVYNAGGQLGWAYIWISSPAVYFALAGRNFDGTERYEEIQTVIEENCNEELLNLYTEKRPNEKYLSLKCPYKWGDITDEMIANAHKRKKKIIMTEKRRLDWLVVVEGYPYDAKQLEEAKATASIVPKVSLTESSDDVDSTTVPTHGYFDISRALVNKSKLNDNININVLVAFTKVTWITPHDIKKVMSHYVTNPLMRPSKLNERNRDYNNNNRHQEVDDMNNTYPIVTIQTNRDIRYIRVVFDSRSMDASFALLMTKKLCLTRRATKYSSNDRGPSTQVLTFNYETNK